MGALEGAVVKTDGVHVEYVRRGADPPQRQESREMWA